MTRPAFIVRLESDYNGNGKRLKWDDAGLLQSVHERVVVYGRFACYPLEEVQARRRRGQFRVEDARVDMPIELVAECLAVARDASLVRVGLVRELERLVSLARHGGD